jgi:ribonucleotide reductase alpha subunit
MTSTNTISINDYILRSRYLNTDETSYEQVCERVCSTIAPNDSFLLQQMKDRKWCPGGRTLAYVGTQQPVSANCLVLPLTGSIIESDKHIIIDSTPIIDTLCRALILQKHGMGIGFSFSKIPQHCIYDNRLHSIGGSFKRLLMLHINHPDIASFIDADYRSFKKVIIVPDKLLENPIGSFSIRRVNYDHKFSMQYPEVLSESTINAIDLLNLIRKSDCTIRSESSIYESSHYYRVSDTLDSIVDILRQISKRTQNGEDYAIDLSRLRKAGSICDHDVKSGGPVSFAFIYDVVVNAINNIHRTNAISWLYVFSACSNIITQTNRNGANIGLLHVNCPDILDFINVKRDMGVINNFNISVCFTNEFMDTLEKNPDLCQTVHESTYDDRFIIKRQIVTSKSTDTIWNAFIASSHASGEPGCIFEGNVNERYSVLEPYMGRIVACNPCGEIMMYPNEVCNLGAINIEEFVDCPSDLTIHSVDINGYLTAKIHNDSQYMTALNNELFKRFVDHFRVDEFKKTVRHVTRFLNSIIDRINVPDQQVIAQVRRMRRLGLGLMGFANLLMKLHIPYTSEAGRRIAGYIIHTMSAASLMESIMLAKRFGSIADRLGITITPEMSTADQVLLSQANIATLCCAPTGSIALMLGTSYSIEPEFRMCYKKAYSAGNKDDDIVINRYFKRYLQENNAYNIENVIDVSEHGISNAVLIENSKSLADLTDQPESAVVFMPNDFDIEVFKSANEITPMEHLLMQAAFQKHIDNSISKTINFANEAGTDDIDSVFREAYHLGIKGTTIYRDRCRDSQVLKSVSSEDIHCKSGACGL